MTDDDYATLLCDIYERRWHEQIDLMYLIMWHNPRAIEAPAVRRWIRTNASAFVAYSHL